MKQTPVINMQKTGENIRSLRISAGLSVRDLQQIFGFSAPQAIYKWESGASLPTVDNPVILSSVLHVKVDRILVCDK